MYGLCLRKYRMKQKHLFINKSKNIQNFSALRILQTHENWSRKSITLFLLDNQDMLHIK